MLNPEILKSITFADLEQLSDLEFAVLWKLVRAHDDWRIECDCAKKIEAEMVIWNSKSAREQEQELMMREKMEMY